MRGLIDFENAQRAGQSPDRLVNATGLSDKSVRSYPIGMILPVLGIGRLILFDAHPSRDVFHQEIWGREVFLFDDGNRLVVNRRPKRTPYRRPKETPFVGQRDGNGRAVRAGCGVGRA